MQRLQRCAWLAATILLAGCALLRPLPAHALDTAPPDPATARTLAEEAYIFAYPMLETYRTLYTQAVDATGPGFRAPFNRFVHATALLGPEFTQIVRPNNDTLYSSAWLDLRLEPQVLTVPAIADRYYSFQMIDMYTYNFAYVGTRATGTGAGSYLIAGPDWAGATPPGVSAVLQSEGKFVYALGRTAVAGSEDVENVLAIQAQYHLQPLSAFLGQPPPPDEPILFPEFDQATADSIGFIGYFNFLLGQLAVHPSEQAMIASFAPIGIGPGVPFDPDALDAATRAAIEEGIASARQQIAADAPALGEMKNGWLLLKRIFGSRAEMQGQYLTRAAAAQSGLFGNSLEEAYYPSTQAATGGRPLDGAQHDYVLAFAADALPPVNAFWSITMYNLPQQLMVANPIDRYSIGDRTPGLIYGDDGSLTLYIQAAPPDDPAQQANWLPAPDGLFALTMRMYLPRPEVLDPLYAPPALEVTSSRVRLPVVASQRDE